MEKVSGGWIVVFITVSSFEEGEKIAKALVNEKLAACINIIDGLKSIYWWKGKVEESSEALLIIKTRIDLFNELVDRVKELHSYTVPEIIAVPIIMGYKGYMDWLNSSVSK